MKLIRLWSPLLAIVFISGCATAPFQGQDLNGQVDRWIEQQEYGKALKALARIRPDQPDHERLIKKQGEVRIMARNYVEKTLSRATQLVKEGNWSAAGELYDIAAQRLPDDDRLRRAIERFHADQAARLAELNLDLLIYRARWLADSLPVQTAITEVDGADLGARRQLKKMKARARGLAQELGKRGQDALREDDLVTARRTLPLAVRLYPSATLKEANELLSRTKARQAIEARQAHARSLDRNRRHVTERLLSDFRQAFTHHNLPEAHHLLLRLEELDGDNPDIQHQRKRLNQALSTEIRRRFEEGTTAYSAGQFEQAISSWRQVLALDPGNNEALSHIERAERVLGKLHYLRNKQNENEKAMLPPAEATE